MSDDQQQFDAIIAGMAVLDAAIAPGNLFGKPCAKLDGKAFVAFFQGDMVFKLDAVRCQEIIAAHAGCQLFDPSGKGRAMKEWVQVPQGTLDWQEMAERALALMRVRMAK
ncbi:MAG: hypothetical protein V3U96_02935 [Paracoccaceae bacterium]